MGPLQKDDLQFIIRQIGNGELYFDGQKTLLKQVSRKARLTETYTATKTKDTWKVKEICDYGGRSSEVNRGEEAVMANCA